MPTAASCPFPLNPAPTPAPLPETASLVGAVSHRLLEPVPELHVSAVVQHVLWDQDSLAERRC